MCWGLNCYLDPLDIRHRTVPNRGHPPPPRMPYGEPLDDSTWGRPYGHLTHIDRIREPIRSGDHPPVAYSRDVHCCCASKTDICSRTGNGGGVWAALHRIRPFTVVRMDGHDDGQNCSNHFT